MSKKIEELNRALDQMETAIKELIELRRQLEYRTILLLRATETIGLITIRSDQDREYRISTKAIEAINDPHLREVVRAILNGTGIDTQTMGELDDA